MKSLLAWTKRALKQAALGVFLCGIGAWAQGKPHLIVPIIAGCLVAAACWVVIGYRILKSAELKVDEAKQSMLFGWILRLVLMMGSLIAAIRISTEVFWAVVIGLFFTSGILMANAIVYAYGSNANKK